MVFLHEPIFMLCVDGGPAEIAQDIPRLDLQESDWKEQCAGYDDQYSFPSLIIHHASFLLKHAK
jgi:hypothetical protein